MAKAYQIYQVDAFTRTLFEGNPAGVVLGADGLTDLQTQAIARELNASETAFVLRARSADHDVYLRFFTPTTEVPVCGHATIAAHYVRAIEGIVGMGSIRQLTGAGDVQIDVKPAGQADVRIWMHQRPPTFEAQLAGADRATLLAALGLAEADIGAGPIEIASTGHSTVMIPLRSPAMLDGLAPDLARLARFSKAITCNGCHRSRSRRRIQAFWHMAACSRRQSGLPKIL